MADTKDVPTRGPQTFEHHCTKFSRQAFVSLCATRLLTGKLLLYCLAQKVQSSPLSVTLVRHFEN